MLTIRAARWPDDVALLAGLDTSFTTDRIYRVVREPLAFTLVEERLDPPLRKEYGPVTQSDSPLEELEHAIVAEVDGELAGFAAAEYERWSRRMGVRHVHVAADYRGRGVGRALIRRLEAMARAAGARCLWLDTQNTNYPAIQFYQRVGFRLCGLDESFCEPSDSGRDEIALFFVRELTDSNVSTA
jgi:ribosomal protein S18 acetylase RimI-like enzyme